MAQDLEIVELRIQMHTNMDTQVELTADQIDNKKVSIRICIKNIKS